MQVTPGVEAYFPFLFHRELDNLLVPGFPLLLLLLLPHHGEEVHGVGHGVYWTGRLHSHWTVFHLDKYLWHVLDISWNIQGSSYVFAVFLEAVEVHLASIWSKFQFK